MATHKKQVKKDLEGSYVLPRNLEIAEIGNVYKEIKKIIGSQTETYKKFVLDAGEVALIDTAGVQLLLQVVRSLRMTGCELSWANDSIQIYQMAAELGVAEELE